MGAEKLCACDRTRQALLCADIRFVDTVQEPFLAIVKSLSDVKDVFWMSPFRGIPRGPQASRFDVVYLDENCRVLDFVVNFAESEFEPITEIPASALILPTHSLGSFPIKKGDQLRICRGNRVIADSGPADIEQASFCSARIEEPPNRVAAQRSEEPVLKPDDAIGRSGVGEKRPSLWVRFLRWLFPAPASKDRRRGERLPEPGLVAYYWTGGSPKSYALGNVSNGGLYLLTDERWLPGTRIVMTLQRSDTRETNDVCRVESKVIRWGDDGVGCEFVDSGFFDLNTGEVIEGQKFDRIAFEQFLLRIRGSDAWVPQNKTP